MVRSQASIRVYSVYMLEPMSRWIYYMNPTEEHWQETFTQQKRLLKDLRKDLHTQIDSNLVSIGQFKIIF